MKKLVLKIDALRVESFEPAGTDRPALGTVRARESIIDPSLGITCPNQTCPEPPTRDTTPQCCV